MTLFIRVLDPPPQDKADALLAAVQAVRSEAGSGSERLCELNSEVFRTVPGSPFAYWVTEGVRQVFQRFERFERAGRTAKQGLTTSDDFRFLRTWWEVRTEGLSKTWFPFVKGGDYRPFYADIALVVKWTARGSEMKAWIDSVYGDSSWSRSIRSPDLYFVPGLTWPLRAVGLSMSPVPRGAIFSARGYLATAPEPELLPMLGLMSSRIFEGIFRVCLSGVRPEFIVGILNALPFPALGSRAKALAVEARQAWSQMRSLDTANEVSHAFTVPTLLQRSRQQQPLVADTVAEARRALDQLSAELFGLSTEDVTSLLSTVLDDSPELRDAGANEDADAEEVEEHDADAETEGAGSLHSWLVGVAFGRFDSRLATGDRAIPPEPEPFDALPSRSPGMCPEGEEPADRPDILVDDEGHADDLAAHARAVAERVRIDVPENLRGWLAKEFFPLHIKMYSKSRRKAPIYWQLATPSASYSVWLYIHAFSKDTLFRVQNDYAAPKLAHEERRLESLTSELRDGATAAQRKALATQENVVEELRAFLDEVKRVTPLWNPNLDDGVVISFAPLWRLVPQNKSWQKELKSTWAALCEGKYDWAHLAMHLWPERVVPKCANDRSLAIAHGLEDVFWVEGSDGKWTARKTPTRSIDELVRERTSPAVKAALKSLLEAPTATGSGRGGAGRRRMAEEGGSR